MSSEIVQLIYNDIFPYAFYIPIRWHNLCNQNKAMPKRRYYHLNLLIIYVYHYLCSHVALIYADIHGFTTNASLCNLLQETTLGLIMKAITAMLVKTTQTKLKPRLQWKSVNCVLLSSKTLEAPYVFRSQTWSSLSQKYSRTTWCKNTGTRMTEFVVKDFFIWILVIL